MKSKYFDIEDINICESLRKISRTFMNGPIYSIFLKTRNHIFPAFKIL